MLSGPFSPSNHILSCVFFSDFDIFFNTSQRIFLQAQLKSSFLPEIFCKQRFSPPTPTPPFQAELLTNRMSTVSYMQVDTEIWSTSATFGGAVPTIVYCNIQLFLKCRILM